MSYQMGFSSSHNSTFQSRDCSSELDFATPRIKPNLCGSRASVARELADTIGQHVDQVSVDISANTRSTCKMQEGMIIFPGSITYICR